MTVELDLAICEPDKTYEYLAHQIEREDNLYQTRLTTCVVVNLGLGAAVASQISTDMNNKTYIIVIACCVIGYLITRGIRIATNAGQIQIAYLRKCIGDLIVISKGKFPYPFYHLAKKTLPGLLEKLAPLLAKLTAIPIVFEMIWAGTFLFVAFVFFNSR